MIQAEATVLGFFGIVVSHVLVSYDTRIDRLEQQQFDCESAKQPQEIVSCYGDKIKSIKKTRKEGARVLALIGCFFIASLLLSITTLGSVDANSTYSEFSYWGLGLFLGGVLRLVFSFTMISQGPESNA